MRLHLLQENTLPSRADSDNAEDATILWCHVPYSEMSR